MPILCYNVKKVRTFGLGTPFLFLKRRPGIAVGIVTFFATVFVLSGVMMDVKYIGSGAVYGSDDLLLDPITNTYVEYGTILDKYYALMFGKVEEGNYTEQEKEAMEKYFAILYGGFDEEGE